MPAESLQQDARQPTHRETRWLIGIVAVALALRLGIVVLRSPDLHTDPDAYVALATTMVETRGLNSPGTTVPTAFRPPLYPVVLASLMILGLTPAAAVCVTALFSGAVVTIAVWWCARVLGMRSASCVTAAALVAFDPLLLRYSPVPMTETLTAALLMVALLQMHKLIAASADDNRAAAAGRLKSAMMAGVAFAAAGYCRPVCFLTCGIVTAGLVIQSFFSSRDTGRRISRIRVAALPAVVAAVLLIPWIVRNAVQLNAFIPLTSHGGYTLLLGNNDVFYREVVRVPGQPVWTENSLNTWQHELHAELLQDGVTSESAQDEWMYHRAKRDILAAPDLFARACLLRWKRFWGIQPRVGGQFAWRWVIGAVGIWYLLQWTGLVAAL